MSTFLGPLVYQTIPASYTPLQVETLIKTQLVNRGWQIKAEQATTQPYTLDVIPPSSETIGNAAAYEFLRITVSNTTIGLTPFKHWNAQPQRVVFSVPGTGSQTTLTIGSVSVTAAAGNTAAQNAALLYAALQVTPQGYGWRVDYPSPQNADDTAIYLVGTCSTIKSSADTWTVAGVTKTFSIPPSSTGFDLDPAMAGSPLTVAHDLVNGYVLILSVFSRSLHLATRTNTAYYGAVHASWCDHALALASIPAGSPLATPIELAVGTDDTAATLGSLGYTACDWNIGEAMQSRGSGYFGLPIPGSTSTVYCLRGQVHDAAYVGSRGSAVGFASHLFFASYQMINATSPSNDHGTWNMFQIHAVGMSAWMDTPTMIASGAIFPPYYASDWYRFRGTLTDENCVVAPDVSISSSLPAALGASDVAVPVADLSVFQAAGTVWINGEAINYTGRGATSGAGNLTGCTRGQYGTLAQIHASGDTVSQCRWYLKINGSAIACGWTKPVASA